MKKVLLYIIIIFFTSCNKSDFLNGIEFQKYLLAGSGNYHNTEHTWYLDSLVINNVPYKLTTKDKTYNKTFYKNGTYSDSDGYTGKWNISKIDELLIAVKSNTLGSYIETKSSIIDINSFKFSYSVTGLNNVKYDYYFKISYE
jgi:hypothetical protein